jgi:HEAT repeat protein
VTIKASAAREIEALTAGLTGSNSVARDAAVARLIVIGARAVERLVRLAESGTEAGARVAALRALEGIGDPRALAAALRLTDDPLAAVAAAAVSLARVFIRHAKGPAAIDGLTALALDGTRPEEIRAAAVRALKDLEPSTIAPLLKSLTGDASALVRAEAHSSIPARLSSSKRRSVRDSNNGAPTLGPDAAPADRQGLSTGTVLSRVVDEGLPDDADSVRQMLVCGGDRTALPVLVRLVDRIHERESAESPNQRAVWTAARALAHLVLARRGSRIALYDLRDSLEQTSDPLPVDALAALSLIGDASCLEPIASSYARSTDAWWKDRLTDVFRAIVERERLTKRHAKIKRIGKRWKPALGALWAGETRRRITAKAR